jgi:hypothetical protein
MNETAREWITKADGDFRTAGREILVEEGPNFDAVCYHAQQCIEKLMKANRRKQVVERTWRALIGAVPFLGSLGGCTALGEPPDLSKGATMAEVERYERLQWVIGTPGVVGFLLLTSGLFEGGSAHLARRRKGRGGD